MQTKARIFWLRGLILLHKKPYVDFFYNQAPLLPYIYAAWMKLAGVSWRSAKLFAALLTAALGTLVYLDVFRRTRKRLAGAVGRDSYSHRVP